MIPSIAGLSPAQRQQATLRLQRELDVMPMRWDAIRSCFLDGAAIDTVGRLGRTALMEAAEDGRVDLIRFLLGLGADVNGAGHAGGTALMEAATAGVVDCVRLLIARGARVNQVADLGWTALMGAALNGRVDVLRELVTRGAAIDQVDRDGHAALRYAACNGQTDSVRVLLEMGASVDLRASNGTTALLAVVYERAQPDVIPALIVGGADPLAAMADGRTVLDLLDFRHPGGHGDVVMREMLDDSLAHLPTSALIERVLAALGPERSMRLLPRCMATQAQRTRTGSWRRLISRWVRRIVDNEGLTRAAPG